MDTTFLTEKEASKRLLAKKDTLRKWRSRGRGPAYLKLAGKIRYKPEDIQKFIEASRVEPGAKRRRRKGARA